jgi:hypothetical protein
MKFSARASATLSFGVSLGFLGCSTLHGSPDVAAPRSHVLATRLLAEPPSETAKATSPTGSGAAGEPAQDAPTWSTVYARYLSPTGDGGCGRSRACHADVMGDSASAYAWLAQWGYIAGKRSPLVSRTNSCLSWFGGNMPPRAQPNDAAVRDLTAWVASGATRN